MKNILNICFIIIGTIIGAGFASGKEIYTFFCVHGFYGFLGLLISNLIICYIIFFTFYLIKKYNINNYSEIVDFLVEKNSIINYTINNIINIFLLISFIVMVSAFGSYLKQEFNFSIIYGAIIICILAILTFYKNINGIIKINSMLVPVLIFLIVFLGFKEKIFLISSFNFNNNIICSNKSWLLHAILYSSYNSIILIPIIINLNSFINNKKQIKFVTLLTFILLVISSLIIFIVLYININQIKKVDIPIVYITSNWGFFYKYIYGFTILSAIYTTAISTGYSFLNNISKNKNQYFIYSIILCVIAVIFSNIGFSTLLNLLYPILGFLGLFQIIIMLVRFHLNH